MTRETMMGLAEAAQKLRLPYQDCHRLLLTGVLRGKKRHGRWYVLLEDVEELRRERSSSGPSSDLDGAPR
jgi:hypothetical protein